MGVDLKISFTADDGTNVEFYIYKCGYLVSMMENYNGDEFYDLLNGFSGLYSNDNFLYEDLVRLVDIIEKYADDCFSKDKLLKYMKLCIELNTNKSPIKLIAF
jgi:hypothetical protein